MDFIEKDGVEVQTILRQKSGSRGPNLGLSPEGMICERDVAQIRNPNIEI